MSRQVIYKHIKRYNRKNKKTQVSERYKIKNNVIYVLSYINSRYNVAIIIENSIYTEFYGSGSMYLPNYFIMQDIMKDIKNTYFVKDSNNTIFQNILQAHV